MTTFESLKEPPDRASGLSSGEEVLFTKGLIEALPKQQWGIFNLKRPYIEAIKINRPFRYQNKNGDIFIIENGYLILDSYGYPYGIEAVEFEAHYELAPLAAHE